MKDYAKNPEHHASEQKRDARQTPQTHQGQPYRCGSEGRRTASSCDPHADCRAQFRAIADALGISTASAYKYSNDGWDRLNDLTDDDRRKLRRQEAMRWMKLWLSSWRLSARPT